MHYSKEQLSQYIDRTLDWQTTDAIEKHLSACDKCAEEFLSLITFQNIADAELIVPKKFTKSVMAAAEKEKRLAYKRQQKKLKPKWQRSAEILPFYVAAAVLTIFLSGSGLFLDLFSGFNVAGTVRPETKHTLTAEKGISARLNQFYSNFTEFADGIFAFEGGVSIEQ